MKILISENQSPTIEQRQAEALNRTLETGKNQYQALCRMQKQGIEAVWKSPLGLTPEQVVEAMGTSAAKIFNLHAVLTGAIMQMAALDGVAPDIHLPTRAFVRNDDGTVTKRTIFSTGSNK